LLSRRLYEIHTLRIFIIVLAVLFSTLTEETHAGEGKKAKGDQVQANLKRFDQLDFDAYSQPVNAAESSASGKTNHWRMQTARATFQPRITRRRCSTKWNRPAHIRQRFTVGY
jgi:hypothetical protein